MVTAPVLLFTYKRLETLAKTVSLLKENFLAKDTELYVFSDGNRNEKDFEQVSAVRKFIKEITGFKALHIYESPINKGLAQSIIDGVSHVLSKVDSVIVLEDDLSTTKNFLDFMNYSLDFYKDQSEVFSISGYSFNLGVNPSSKYDGYFTSRGWSWGWATWKDRWLEIDWDVSDYQSFRIDKNATKAFSLGGSDLNSMLAKQMNGELDSWAIRWFYHQFKVGGKTLYPVTSKVFNSGFDQDATHTDGSERRYLPLLDVKNEITFNLPSVAINDTYYLNRFRRKMGIGARVISKIETFIKKLGSRSW